MSRHILAVISRLPQLRGSLRHSAQRLAFFATPQGQCEKSYGFLGADRKVHASTAKRHIARLIAAEVITKEVRRLRHNRCAINVYRFTPWVMALVHERAAGSRTRQEQPSREKKRSASGMPDRPQPFPELLQGCREVLTRLGCAPRSP